MKQKVPAVSLEFISVSGLGLEANSSLAHRQTFLKIRWVGEVTQIRGGGRVGWGETDQKSKWWFSIDSCIKCCFI